uniref:CurG, CurH fusion protein n=1 Tax=Moorena producens 3L TaxID=489825 RepID=UPI0003E5C682|nr:Chain A, CurG, CurH fusion protein [Moorena producens 3L]4MYY_B Chain B, CurG, CurH fusion protein [Moorena producens 3L]
NSALEAKLLDEIKQSSNQELESSIDQILESIINGGGSGGGSMLNKFTKKEQILSEKQQIKQLSPLQRAALALKKLETKLNNTLHE